jgi:catechol 2,3-dioxygenase-like lactoylglutathione lyase family enzyme
MVGTVAGSIAGVTEARISHVILRVASLDAAVAFWQGVMGLSVAERFGAFAMVDLGPSRIALNEAEGGDPSAAGSSTEVVLEVEDPRERYERWSAAGVEFEVELRPVVEVGGRIRLAAHFRDPDGHLVSLTGWVDA